MNTSTTIPPIDQLRVDYETKSEECKRYRTANFIFSLSEADITYLQLLIERSIAEKEYRKAKGELIHIPRIERQLQHYRNLLQSHTGVII